ncbi:LPS translocon maturation chaperone LptM [Marinospirillum perlucidum]|nr:lipoprotein [Marinospirillum perlucidum]
MKRHTSYCGGLLLLLTLTLLAGCGQKDDLYLPQPGQQLTTTAE